MIALLRKELQAKALFLTVLSVAAILFALMYLAIFPSIKQQAQSLTQLLASMPSVLQVMGLQNIGFTSLEGFLSIEYFSILWPLFTFIFIISWSGSSLAGEIEQGSLGLLLSWPLSRSTIYWVKYLAIILGLLIYTFLSLGSIPLFASAFHLAYHSSHLWKTTVMCFLFGWAFLTLAYLVSSLASERSKVTFFTSGLAVLMYVASAIAGLKPSLNWLKHFSFFSYLNIQEVLVHGTWSWLAVVIFAATILISSTIGAWVFSHRDIPV